MCVLIHVDICFRFHSHQAGVLEKSMEAAEKVGKAQMSTEKALDSIAKQSETTFQEAVEKQQEKPNQEIKLADVTHRLFQTPVVEKLPESSMCIYRGIVANLMSWGRNGQGQKICGIMSGDGKTVLDVVICTDFKACIKSPELSKRLSSLGLQTMGITVWVDDFDVPIEKCSEPLRLLESPFKKQLLVVMCGGLDPRIWEATIVDGDVKFTRCNGSKATSGRKKQESYRVVDFSALGKDTTDNMKEAVSTAFQSIVKDHLSKKTQHHTPSEKHELYEYKVPADGFCLWHSILGACEFESWNSIPRKEDSGYATNNRLVKKEEDRARSFMESAMTKASESEGSTSRIEEIIKTGSVEVTDLDWIATILKIAIRCTIADEAHSGGFGFGLGNDIYII